MLRSLFTRIMVKKKEKFIQPIVSLTTISFVKNSTQFFKQRNFDIFSNIHAFYVMLFYRFTITRLLFIVARKRAIFDTKFYIRHPLVLITRKVANV